MVGSAERPAHTDLELWILIHFFIQERERERERESERERERESAKFHYTI